MADRSNGQEDWGAGIYRGREAPENAAYDLLNLLLDDEGQPFRRGGSAYKSNADVAGPLTTLWDGEVFAGRRTLFGTSTASSVLAADDATPFALGVGVIGRPVAVGPFVFFRSPSGANYVIRGYAGARKGNHAPGNVSITAGSTTLTVSAGGLLANVEKGHQLPITSMDHHVIDAVLTDTTARVRDKATQTAAAVGGMLIQTLVTTASGAFPAAQLPGPLASAARRLIITLGNRAIFSPPGDPYGAAAAAPYDWASNYHEISGGAIVGAEGVGDALLLFTAAGVWAISNMEFDPIDDAGNVQHTVRQLNELILWGDEGVAQWRSIPVVPAVDNVWLMPVGAEPVPIGDGIKALYRGYVQAGYQPGVATVHRGHYFLPILNGATVIDVLVCRLDRGFAWTRWSGHAAGPAFAQRIGSATRAPRLLGVSGQRVTDLTETFNPSAGNASEADGTTHSITAETRDYPTLGSRRGGTTEKLAVTYETTGAGTLTAQFARGPEGAAYTTLTLARDTGAGASDGLTPGATWRVAKRAPAIRFKITSTSAWSSFKLRRLEAPWRSAT